MPPSDASETNRRLTWVLLGTALISGCHKGAGVLPEIPPVDVAVVTLAAHDAPVQFEYVGQIESSRLVEIRARVDGYLQRRFYEEGSIVREGAPLFQIDPRQLDAMVQSAHAIVQQNESRLLNAHQTAQRLKPLVADEAVSHKDMEDAQEAEKSAAAALEAARADLTRAEMQLGYTRLVSPFAGLAGKANVAEGSYVNPGQNGLLTTVEQLDPIFVNFSLSQSDWLRYADELKKGTLRFPAQAGFDVQLALSETQVLPTRGHLNFSSQTVDPATGSYAIRASFPNHDLLLRPGQFVQVRLLGAVRPGALLVPQRAVIQGQKGKFVYVVGAEDKAEERPIEVGDWVGDQWLVTTGLKSGDRVVVDGMIKVQPGAPVKVTVKDARAAQPASPAASAPASNASAARLPASR